MRRLLLATLLLLSACTFDLRGNGEPLQVEVSEYPKAVPQGGSFEVFIDVLSVTEPLEVAVVPLDEVSVDETMGGSYVLLAVSAAEDAQPDTYTLTVNLKSGTATSQLALGFTVTPAGIRRDPTSYCPRHKTQAWAASDNGDDAGRSYHAYACRFLAD